MSSVKTKFYLFVLLALVVAGVSGFVVFKFYPYVFSKTVIGEIVGVERVNTNETIVMGGVGTPAAHLFSFAVAVRDMKNQIHTASSEDRQWALAQKGQCVEAKIYPYPPWELAKWGTYYNARLIRLFECPDKKPAPEANPATPAPAPEPSAAPSMQGPPQS